MISEETIAEWRKEAPWLNDSLVEQDLVLSRALVEMFSLPSIAERLALRGGTALHKLCIRPAARYSEDIDLVQIHPEGINNTLNLIREILDPWLNTPEYEREKESGKLTYRFKSADNPPAKLRLKIEINTREHFTEMGYKMYPFNVDTRWFSGRADVISFSAEELLGTKFRALYRRSKGRDLFDLWCALDRGIADPPTLMRCYERYISEDGRAVPRAIFEANLLKKADDPDFRDDMKTLLRPGLTWNFDEGLRVVMEQLVSALPRRRRKMMVNETRPLRSTHVQQDAGQAGKVPNSPDRGDSR